MGYRQHFDTEIFCHRPNRRFSRAGIWLIGRRLFHRRARGYVIWFLHGGYARWGRILMWISGLLYGRLFGFIWRLFDGRGLRHEPGAFIQ